MNKAGKAATAGAVAGLVLGGAYFAAPSAGLRISPEEIMVLAAVFAFASAVSLLTLAALNKPEKKKEKSKLQLSDLSETDYAHFPLSGARIVLRPETEIGELDVVRNPAAYLKSDIFLTIKKSSGKQVFNPILLAGLFDKLKDFEKFIHILLVNEHDEYIGYIPAAYARMSFHSGADNVESVIRKYVVDVLAAPLIGSILHEINGLSIDECVADHILVADALKKVSEGLLRGLVVFKNKRNRKPLGVIYAEDLVKLAM
jgi:hypothetical protein